MVPRSRQETEYEMTDQERMQGTWRLIAGEQHGKPLAPEVLETVRLEFSGETLSTSSGAQVHQAKFTLYVETIPKGIDLEMGGAVGRGIYEFEGESLRILHGTVGDARPTELRPLEATTLTILELTRTSRNQT